MHYFSVFNLHSDQRCKKSKYQLRFKNNNFIFSRLDIHWRVEVPWVCDIWVVNKMVGNLIECAFQQPRCVYIKYE